MPLLYPKPNPLQKANLCSRLFFWWLNPLFKIGHKRKLEANDMYSALPEDRSQHLGEELQGYWDQEVLRAQKDVREPSLMKAIVKCYGKSYLVWGMLTFLENFLLLDETSQCYPQLPSDGRTIVDVQAFTAFGEKVRILSFQNRDC
uniref:Uncharacterized protein n=1 Tax=Bos indicus x Bos taurus TaxID=30522 RepID=A0A4W2FWM1_BOBOX